MKRKWSDTAIVAVSLFLLVSGFIAFAVVMRFCAPMLHGWVCVIACGFGGSALLWGMRREGHALDANIDDLKATLAREKALAYELDLTKRDLNAAQTALLKLESQVRFKGKKHA